MKNRFSRADTSILSQWWWTVDRWNFIALIVLIGIGFILNMAASPAVAERVGLPSFHFIQRQIIFILMGFSCIFFLSLMNPIFIRRIGVFVFIMSILLMIVTLIFGAEVKGAKRWIRLAGFSLQPSEFIKPGIAIFCAWMFTEKRANPHFPGILISFVTLAVVLFLLLLQPDLGMSIMVCAILFGQLFLSGLSLWITISCIMAGIFGLFVSYFTFSHVANRINSFLDPEVGDRYQINKSLESFYQGGFFGVGPGEGTVKNYLPDAHSDFIFSVAAEEFGLILCLIIVIIYGFIILRSVARCLEENNLFIFLANTGFLIHFGLQAIINIASSMHLIPTKGMTLPFISYGGSSFLALSFSMGMLLGLTRKRPFGSYDLKLEKWSQT